jgi:hypothetical protein
VIEYLIYPTEEELREATEVWMSENHQEYFTSMSEKAWKTYYNKNIEGPVNII